MADPGGAARRCAERAKRSATRVGVAEKRYVGVGRRKPWRGTGGTGQQQRFRLFDAKPRGEMTKIVVNRQRRGGKNPAPRFLRHHLNFSATVNGVNARVKWREVHSYQ